MKAKETIEITIPKAPLKRNERHPAAQIALDFVKDLSAEQAYMYMTVFKQESTDGSFDSCIYAMEQLLNGKMISDTYLLGLMVTIQETQRLNKESE